MMKIVEGVFTCVFLINCACVISYASSDETLWCPIDIPSGVNASAEPQCGYLTNITCPPGQGCCRFDDRDLFDICVNLNDEPADCIDNELLYDFGVTSLKHGEKLSDCYSRCSCYNGDVRCGENVCLQAGNIMVIIAILGIPPIAGITCICACFCYLRKRCKRGRRGEKNTRKKVDNPPSYKKAVRMPISISETIKEDVATPPTYDEAVNIA